MIKVELRPIKMAEFDRIVEWEQDGEASRFLMYKSYDAHVGEMESENASYFTILRDGNAVGYISLFLDEDGVSVECRRVVVSERGKGTGRLAMMSMEAHVINVIKRHRIWLDVFTDNARGRHLYEKLGYREFDQSICEGRVLHLYEKWIEG